MKNNILNSATRAFYKFGFKVKKHSPELLIGAGIISGAAGAVVACRATTKVSDILYDTKEQVDQVHYALNNPEKCKEEYTEEDSKKDLIIIYAKTGFELAKLYAPAIALGALSVTSILAGSNIMRKRNVALSAAYMAVDKGFKDYRGRVVNRFGERVDYELKHNIRAEEIETTTIGKNGKEKVVKETIDVMGDPDEYSKFFDEGSKYFEKNAELNLFFLKAQEEYANNILRTKGHLFLNDVYDLLGIPKTQVGQIMGWIWNEDYACGEKRVDFSIHNVYYEPSRNFVNGVEPRILLNFNIDGNVYKELA